MLCLAPSGQRKRRPHNEIGAAPKLFGAQIPVGIEYNKDIGFSVFTRCQLKTHRCEHHLARAIDTEIALQHQEEKAYDLLMRIGRHGQYLQLTAGEFDKMVGIQAEIFFFTPKALRREEFGHVPG